jgi:hypothetical protein
MLLARNLGCLVEFTRAALAARIINKSTVNLEIGKRGFLKILIMVLIIN